MKTLIIISITLLISLNIENDKDYVIEIQKFQKELNETYLDKEKTPLSKKHRKVFKKNKGHAFFPIDQKYQVKASFEKVEKGKSIEMNTSTTRIAHYDIYGKAIFSIDGKEYILNIYQSHILREKEEYKDYLFLPFTDLTSGEETYGGGRYIDIRIPEGNFIEIDFNKSYHPYCAYSSKYSCPIPPRENFINTKIKAGVKNLDYVLN